MNAVMHKYGVAEDTDMPVDENDNLGIQVAELRADVRHIQSDVTDIKADLRITNQRLDSFRKEPGDWSDKLDQKLESFRKEAGGRSDKLDQKLDSFRKEAGDRSDKLDQKFDQKFDLLKKDIGEVKDSLASAKVWALGLYIALTGSLLYVLARGFKWL